MTTPEPKFLTSKIIDMHTQPPSKREAAIIIVLENSARSVGAILERMNPRPSNVRNVQEYLRRLERKGFVLCVKHKVFPKRETNQWMLTDLGRALVQELKSNTIEKKMVAYLQPKK